MPGGIDTLPGYSVLPEPRLLFGAKQTDIHPLRGLTKLGPYSADLGFPKQVRLAYLTPAEHFGKLDDIVAELNGSAVPREALNYYPRYPGFQSLFRIPLVQPPDSLRLAVPDECMTFVQRKDGPGLLGLILHSVGGLMLQRSAFDVLLVYLPRAWEDCYEYEGFDLHDRLKAAMAPQMLTMQVVNDIAFERKCRANVMWGMSVALYAKAGGIPWKIADSAKDEAYIGIGYAIKRLPDGNAYSTCCSQVFDPDGTGFEFVAYDAREFHEDQKGNPFLSYQEMQSVLSRSLLLYQNGHSGRIPRKVFVHKTTHFTRDEIQGAFDAFGGKTELELVQVVRGVNWYGLKVDRPKRKGDRPSASYYPVDRGLYLPLTETECFLWTQGSVMGVNQQDQGKPVFKEGGLKPLPNPIMLRRFSGEAGWHDTCSSILALTKVDWNNNTLYKTLPVTLVYSQVFANVVKQTPEIVDETYDYRFFM